MSHQFQNMQPATSQAPRRPGVLLASVGSGFLAGVLSLAASLVLLVNGRQIVEDFMTAEFGADAAELAASLVATEIDRAVSALEAKAMAGVVFATLVTLLAVLALNASRTIRAFLAVVIIGSLLMTFVQLVESDLLPGYVVAMASLGMLFAVVSFGLIFLPPVNRFGKYRRNAARS